MALACVSRVGSLFLGPKVKGDTRSFHFILRVL